MNLKVIYEDNHLIVVEKKENIPVQKDISNDLDLISIIKDYIKKKDNKKGNVYLGMVHRLDRPVGGIMVFAKTSKAASRLSNEIKNNRFEKQYLAVVHGQFKKKKDILEHYLIKDKKTNTSKVVSKNNLKAKLAILNYEVLKYDKDKNLSLLLINLHTGRHHQIRVQLKSINHPILGDQKYGLLNERGIQIYLWAYKISFMHPTKKELLTFYSKPKWQLFKADIDYL